MAHNDLHYLAAVTMFGDRAFGGTVPPSFCASFQDSRPKNDVPRAVENRGSTSFGWMSVHPEAVLLRRAQNLLFYLLRPGGGLKQYSNGPMSAPIRRYPQDAGERRVTT